MFRMKRCRLHRIAAAPTSAKSDVPSDRVALFAITRVQDYRVKKRWCVLRATPSMAHGGMSTEAFEIFIDVCTMD